MTSEDALLKKKAELRRKLSALQNELKAIRKAELHARHQGKDAEKARRIQIQSDVKQRSLDRYEMAYKLRREGKTFAEIGIALGGVSATRARSLFFRGWRLRQKGKPKDQWEPWDYSK